MEWLLYIGIPLIAIVLGLLLFRKGKTKPEESQSHARVPREKTDPREEQIDNSAQTIRSVLLKLTDALRHAGDAADNSSISLSAAREQISALALDDELKQAQQMLLGEIDRVMNSNNALNSELAKAQKELDEQRKQIDSLRTAVRIDGLTQIGNRAHFDERLAEALEHTKRYEEVFSLILIDIDHFKNVNDNHGHLTGDNILKSLAKIFKATLRASDFVARYGGEEFAMIIFKSDENAARGAAQELRRAVETTGFKDKSGNRIPLTISAGVAQSEKVDTPTSLIERADKALYRAKNSGRNRVVCAGE